MQKKYTYPLLLVSLLLAIGISSFSGGTVQAQTKKKITDLTADTAPTSDDLVETVNDPGGTPASRKATLSNLTKGLASASASVQGVVDTTTQTFAGTKTINGVVLLSAGSATSALTANGSYTAMSTLVPDASAVVAGKVSTGTQTFAGAKTFDSTVAGQYDFTGTSASIFVSGGILISRDSAGTNSVGLSTTVHRNTKKGVVGATAYNTGGGTAQFEVLTTGAAVVGQNITLSSSQSADAFQVTSSGGSVGDTFKISSAGAVTIAGGTPIVKVLSATATLDFPSTMASATSDLTITVTGAALGDVVSCGVPNASVTTTGAYSYWVSATDTVSVRFLHSAIGSEDPASGVFRVQVTKF